MSFTGHKAMVRAVGKGTLWLSALSLLGGCVVGPNYSAPAVTLPAKWANNTTSAALLPHIAGWWRQFDDSFLNQLIDSALKDNTDLAIAIAKVREARANVALRAAPLFPSLTGSATGARQRALSGVENSQFQGGFDAGWELDLFGANKRGLEAAKYGLDAASEELRAVSVTLIGDIATNYVEARGLRQRINLAKRTAAVQQQTLALTRDKFAAGAASQLDVSNSEGQAASTLAQIPALEAQLAQSVHRLSILTGNSPAFFANRFNKSAKIPQPKWQAYAAIPAAILLTRPDIRLAERQYAQATANLAQAEAQRWPTLSLSGAISSAATRVGDLGRNSTLSWSLGPALNIPLFQGGQLAAQAEVADALRDQAFISYRSAILTGLEEVENGLVNFNQERARSQKLYQSSQAYGRAVALTRGLYQSGNISIFDLLTAESQAYSAEQSYLESQVAITTYYISLMKALGGGWDGVMSTSKTLMNAPTVAKGSQNNG